MNPRHLPLQTLLVAMLLAAAPGAAQAHDFWLGAERGPGNDRTAVRLWFGHHLAAEGEQPYSAARTTSLRLLRDGSDTDLAPLAVDGAQPFLQLPGADGRPMLLALDRAPTALTLASARFDAYLDEEFLADIRSLRGADAPDGRERYTRHVKLLLDPAAGSDLHARRLGQALEIVLLDAPVAPAAGRQLRARVLFDGAPLPGRTVTILSDADGLPATDNARVATAVTDADGTVRFAFDQAGTLMLRLVHMQPCTVACDGADWRSYWGAFAVRVPE